MVKMRIPATSANMGAGFDSLGIALSLYNYIQIEESDNNEIIVKDKPFFRFNENNLIYKSVINLSEICGLSFKGIKITQESQIPPTRGLGSSAACITAGLIGANELLKKPLSLTDIINLAAEIEGHPDNSTPAILGGFTSAVLENKKVYYTKTIIKKNLKFAAFIPSFHMKTKESRNVLPSGVSFSDAVFNISRASLFANSIQSGKYENLKVGVCDKLHQNFRLPFIENSAKIFEIAYSLGAYAVYLSGAGSTIIALIDSKNHMFKQNAIKLMQSEKTGFFRLKILSADNSGATII